MVGGIEILNRPMPTQLVQQITDSMEMGELVYMLEGADKTYTIRDGTLLQTEISQFYASDEFNRVLDERRRGLTQSWDAVHGKCPIYKIDFMIDIANYGRMDGAAVLKQALSL